MVRVTRRKGTSIRKADSCSREERHDRTGGPERDGGGLRAAPNDGPGATFSFSIPQRWALDDGSKIDDDVTTRL